MGRLIDFLVCFIYVLGNEIATCIFERTGICALIREKRTGICGVHVKCYNKL